MTMTDKQIRNKMYALFSDFARKYKKGFIMTDEERRPIKEVMEEYRMFFNSKPMKVEFYTKKESEWKPYPETK